MTDAKPWGEGLRAAWRRARQRWWVRWGVDLAVMALAALAIMAWQTRNLPHAGTPAPDFQLRSLSGETVRLSDFRGKPVVLAFWAPWCGVCQQESSTLSAVRRTLGDRAHVLSVAVDYSDEAQVQRFVQEHGADYPVLLGDDALRRAFRVNQYPTLFVISPQGTIAQAAIGYTTQAGLLWRVWRSG
ncbi:TlpA family protein disulfide reductase [Stigmatella aurantiaca]|uniref:Thioredoxin-like protein n=1 Tax=Stigmatella aurantiaca (strain DW4/3-1) TaxID=378806 RepID=E3FUH8_STIAD|nr:TlpA disulfide reductase family protein [Stigmatella aurantiaca]ADO74676.1 Thioredoxin-like protein [Stigmatella aurantiaca DW4/3-1]